MDTMPKTFGQNGGRNKTYLYIIIVSVQLGDTYHSVVVQEFVLVVSQHGRKFEEYFPDC